MGSGRLFESIPLWLTFAGTVVIILLSIGGGFLLARFRKKRRPTEEESPVGTAAGAIMGLLAFILAFTFGMTASRFDARKEFLLDEVNAIQTAFLRTGLIPEPQGAAVRMLLKEYVDLRVELVEHPEKAVQTVQESSRLQDLMWSHAEALAEAHLKNAGIAALFVNALNQMFDMQTKRVTVSVYYGIPLLMWMALYALTILGALGVGYLFGISGHVNWLLALVLALALSTVISLIVDLDSSGAGRAGLIQVSQQPMFDLQQWINEQMAQKQAQEDSWTGKGDGVEQRNHRSVMAAVWLCESDTQEI